jgi:hypothetical protein
LTRGVRELTLRKDEEATMNRAQVHEVREAVKLAFPVNPRNRRAPFRFLRSWLQAGESIEYAADRLRRWAGRES